MATVALVSYRLGEVDGVSIESRKWRRALERLGHRVVTVAGAGEADHLVRGLGLSDTVAPDPRELSPLTEADLTVVENVASLPLNPLAREALYDVLEGRRVIFHHHDLAWQRPGTAHLAGPRDAPTWSHVVINELSRRQLGERGVDATLLRNRFDCDPPAGDRDALRSLLNVAAGEPLVLAPTRALARKNIPGALALCERVGATLWLLGPAEDGFDSDLEELLAGARGRVIRDIPVTATIHDAYAACDAVVMASSWEGFGNPVLESVTHRRPLALHRYPVAEELIGYGFQFLDLDDDEGIRAALARPDHGVLEANLRVARRHFDLAVLPELLEELLIGHGIYPPVG